jgi:hypothetical protein
MILMGVELTAGLELLLPGVGFNLNLAEGHLRLQSQRLGFPPASKDAEDRAHDRSRNEQGMGEHKNQRCGKAKESAGDSAGNDPDHDRRPGLGIEPLGESAKEVRIVVRHGRSEAAWRYSATPPA